MLVKETTILCGKREIECFGLNSKDINSVFTLGCAFLTSYFNAINSQNISAGFH